MFFISDFWGLMIPVCLCVSSLACGGNRYIEYKGVCDVSAVVPVTEIGEDVFVVGDDEKNQLITYQLGNPEPLSVFNLDQFQDHGEMDIEGAASFGSYHLWIGSHGRNKHGEIDPSRAVFFATVFGDGKLQRTGVIYKNLVEDLVNSPAMVGLPILDGINTDENYPEGFNIEGIASDERRLVIGLRGPLVGDRAVVMFVDNPLDVVLQNSKAEFSGFELLDLEGRGIRDLYFDAETRKFFIIAGPVSDERGFSLYQWSPGAEPIKIQEISGEVTPEALFISKSSSLGGDFSKRGIHVLSDDGAVNESKKRCNKNPESKQRFRVFDLDVDGV